MAVLVAEQFEELMITTCNLRNENDSVIDWYLTRALANEHAELFFHHVARPVEDIQVWYHQAPLGLSYGTLSRLSQQYRSTRYLVCARQLIPCPEATPDRLRTNPSRID